MSAVDLIEPVHNRTRIGGSKEIEVLTPPIEYGLCGITHTIGDCKAFLLLKGIKEDLLEKSGGHLCIGHPF